MQCVVVLTEAEEQTLQQLSIIHPYQDLRTRAAALLMLAGGKLRPKAVGAKLGVSGQSVYNWAHTWRDQGVIGLLIKIGHKGGRPRALSDEMVAAFVRMVSAEPTTHEPVVQRLEAEFGSLPFGHLDTLSMTLKREVFTFKCNRLSLKKSATRRHSPRNRPRSTSCSGPRAKTPFACSILMRLAFADRRRFNAVAHHKLASRDRTEHALPA
ncbi:helix-turn-helix domain-containing protein [Burkholderia territorii]|uniref:helix-turn-helix domain-containing protein n=1 Tax=Burkholderia territorii TaxID=1503055 RepID=UPI000A4259C8|nr:helix-turn-helix domain-containing protein [Burkholderia territorii]